MKLLLVLGFLLYASFVVFGVVFLTEGKTALGLALIGCVVVGLPSYLKVLPRLWR